MKEKLPKFERFTAEDAESAEIQNSLAIQKRLAREFKKPWEALKNWHDNLFLRIFIVSPIDLSAYSAISAVKNGPENFARLTICACDKTFHR